MPYTPTNWTDGVTPVNATNMNKIEAGVAAAVPMDAVTAAGTRIVASKLVGTDGQPAVRMLGNGRLDWGPGGSTAPDTSLYRSTVNALKTDGNLEIGAAVYSHQSLANGTAYYADSLAADGYAFIAKQASDTTAWRLMIYANGSIGWGPGGTTPPDHALYRYDNQGMMFTKALRVGGAVVVDQNDVASRLYFGSALDTSIYRTAAGWLRLEGGLTSSGDIDPETGRLGRICKSLTDWNTAVDSGWYMGSTVTNGPAALTTWTMGEVIAHGAAGWRVQRVWDFTQPADSQVYERRQLNGTWSSWIKVGLYTASAGVQRTDNSLWVGDGSANVQLNLCPLAVGQGALLVRAGNNGPNNYFQIMGDGAMFWGAAGSNAVDTNLYRSAAATLKTDGSFWVNTTTGVFQVGGSGTQFNFAPATNKITLGGDTTFYRSAANQLKTDGGLIVAGAIALGAQTPGATGSLKFGDGTVQTTAAVGSMVLISEVVLGAAGWLDLASIPGTYRHLRIEMMVRSTTGNEGDIVGMRFNGSTTSYWARGDVATESSQDRLRIARCTGSGSNMNGQPFAQIVIEIPYYSVSGNAKTATSAYACRVGSAGDSNDLAAGNQAGESFAVTVPITQVTFFADNGASSNFVAGSRMSVYGIV
jgi:hypothetical protein